MVSQEDALDRVTQYQFDDSGRRVGRRLPMLQHESLAHALDGNRNSITTTVPGESPHVVTNTHGAAGRIASVSDAGGRAEHASTDAGQTRGLEP